MDCISFADQSADTPITLRRLCAEKNCVLLETFLNSAAATLREEDQRLPRFQRVEIPSFEVFENLTEEYYQGHIRDVRIESALAVVAQLGEYIWFVCEPIQSSTQLTYAGTKPKRSKEKDPDARTSSWAWILVF